MCYGTVAMVSRDRAGWRRYSSVGGGEGGETQEKEQRRQFETFEKFIRENCSVKTALYKEQEGEK